MPTANNPQLEPSWLAHLQSEFDQPYMKTLRDFLTEEKKHHQVFPAGADMFNAFWHTPLDNVNVVILGQDPYHGPKQAHGLCFSVQKDVPKPPSLQNMFKELESDLGLPIPDHGCLDHWAKQGVFLLNTVLSVRAHEAQSHAGKGWETFTDRVIEVINEQRENVIFVLWGKPAQRKIKLIDEKKHIVLTAPHPSPLSSYRGFFGCEHFSKINQHLKEQNKDEVDWLLPA